MSYQPQISVKSNSKPVLAVRPGDDEEEPQINNKPGDDPAGINKIPDISVKSKSKMIMAVRPGDDDEEPHIDQIDQRVSLPKDL